MPLVPPAYPLVNGHRVSPASLYVVMNNLPVAAAGIKSLDYSDTLDPGEVKGFSPQLSGRTRGTYSTNGSVELYAQEWENLRFSLSGGIPGFMEVPFDIIVTFFEPGLPPLVAPSPLDVHALIGCRIKTPAVSIGNDNAPISWKMDLHIMRILYNGASGVAPSASLMPF